MTEYVLHMNGFVLNMTGCVLIMNGIDDKDDDISNGMNDLTVSTVSCNLNNCQEGVWHWLLCLVWI